MLFLFPWCRCCLMGLWRQVITKLPARCMVTSVYSYNLTVYREFEFQWNTVKYLVFCSVTSVVSDSLRPHACPAPLSVEILQGGILGFSRGLPCPPAGDLPNPGIQRASLTSPALTGRSFATTATWEALIIIKAHYKSMIIRAWKIFSCVQWKL